MTVSDWQLFLKFSLKIASFQTVTNHTKYFWDNMQSAINISFAFQPILSVFM